MRQLLEFSMQISICLLASFYFHLLSCYFFSNFAIILITIVLIMVSYFDLKLKFHHLQVKLVIKQPSLDTYRRDL